MPYLLYLATDDADVKKTIQERALTYNTNRTDSGFDLEVYGNADSYSPNAGHVLLSTRVKALVVYQNQMNIVDCRVAAFAMMARSSLPGRGWMLGNSVGLIDRSYRNCLLASLVCHDRARLQRAETMPEEGWRGLVGTRVVQVVAPDLQPFQDVIVLENEAEYSQQAALFGVGDRGGGFGSTGL